MCMNSRVRRYRGADSRLWPGRPEEMMLIVRRPSSIWSIVASCRASCGGHISPIRTATSSCIRRSSGAIPAANAIGSIPIA